MKTWPHCSLNQFSKYLLGMVLFAPSLVTAQSIPTPLQSPATTAYPGVYESFEKIIEFDEQRFNAKANELAKAPRSLADIKDVQMVDLDPDFMNSLILNSPSGYLKLASKDRCTFFSTLIADLLRTKEGKVERVFVQYQNKKGQNISAVIPKQDFLNKAVLQACPQASELIAKFQIKVMDNTIAETNFEIPSNIEQCDVTYLNWLNDSKTPYWCQIHELLADTEQLKSISPSDFRLKKEEDTRQAIAKILRGKLSDVQQDFLRNFCKNADNPKTFCADFFSTNFFSKIVEKTKPESYIRDICQETLAKSVWSPLVLKECVRKLRLEQDACFWGSYESSGLSPRPRCDHLSLALNYSSLFSDYDDCPRYSDQLAITNMSRVLNHTERQPILPSTGFCSTVSAGTVFEFNKKYDNEGIWKSSMCYEDPIEQVERCLPVFFGNYGASTASLSTVVNEILFRTKGAGKDTPCEIVRKADWNPNILKYRYGCQIIVDQDNCGLGRCSYKIMFNEKEIKGLKVKEGLPLDYFPTDLMNEKYSQSYILQKDAQKKMKIINTLTGMKDFFRSNPKGILHGIGCAEDLQPSFFRKTVLNQCAPLPFIIDGIISEGDRAALVTRSAADNIHAPRLVSWSTIYSAVKSYQHHHPVKQWTLYAIY